MMRQQIFTILFIIEEITFAICAMFGAICAMAVFLFFIGKETERSIRRILNLGPKDNTRTMLVRRNNVIEFHRIRNKRETPRNSHRRIPGLKRAEVLHSTFVRQSKDKSASVSK